MTTPIPQNVEAINSTVCGLPSRRGLPQETGMSEEPLYLEIGQRLQAIRTGFSALKQNEWALRHNFSVTQYNNWEKGVRRIPVENAERLCETYGLTLDFIYRGRRDGLSETASKVL